MKRRTVSILLAGLLCCASVTLADNPNDPAMLSDAQYAFSLDAGETPALVLAKSGRGLYLFDRGFIDTDSPGPDYVFIALRKAVERNPGLLRSFFNNVFLPAVPHDEERTVLILRQDQLWWLNEKLVELYGSSGLRRYIAREVLPLVRENPALDAESLPSFVGSWFDGAGSGVRGANRLIICDTCSGTNPVKDTCSPGLCVVDCLGRGSACVEYDDLSSGRLHAGIAR